MDFSYIIDRFRTAFKGKRSEIPFETKIGNQIWTNHNLNVDRYRNGDLILQERNRDTWNTLETGAWCYYNNESPKGLTHSFGKLYNWFAVHDERQLAPLGWHVPSSAEWNELAVYLMGSSFNDIKQAGNKLKAKNIWGWNPQITDSYNFSALPAGYIKGGCVPPEPVFPYGRGFLCHFWASDLSPLNDSFPDKPYFVEIKNDGKVGEPDHTFAIFNTHPRQYGRSVRLVKD